MKQHYFGAVAVVIAAILWSLDGILRRQLFSLPPSTVVFWEHIFGFIILLPVVILAFKDFKNFTRKQWNAIIAVSLLSGAVGTIFYTAALAQVQFIPFSVVVLLQQLQPIFAIISSVIVLKEPLTKRFFRYAITALIAAYFVSFPDLTVNFGTGKGTLIAALLAIGAAASWGVSTALSKYSLTNVSSLQTTAVRFGITPFFALAFVFISGDMSTLTEVSPVQWKYIMAITFSTGLLALAIYYFGLKRIPATRSAILELAWPISAVAVGFFFLGEHLTHSQWVGAIVLVSVMIALGRSTKDKVQ